MNERARLNQQLFNQAVSLGHSPQPGMGGGGGRFTNYLRSLIAQGPVNRTPTPATTPPPAPEIIKPPTQRQATQSSVGQGVRQARGSKKRTRLSDLRISRPRVNTQLAIGAGGTGLNIGGY